MLRWFHAARAGIRSLFARRGFDDQLSADLRFHLEQATAEYIREGLSPDEARTAALRAFGNPAQVMEEVREMALWTWWDRLTQDLRYGLRGFRRSPVFAATAVLSLALGIGANTAIFTVINAALLRSLPVTDPEQLVLIASPATGDFAYPDYLALRDGARVFSDLVGASRTMPVNVGAGAENDRGSVKIVSGNYFAGLGVRAAIGRVFTSADETESVAVISHGYWQRRFGGGPDVLGRQVPSTAFRLSSSASRRLDSSARARVSRRTSGRPWRCSRRRVGRSRIHVAQSDRPSEIGCQPSASGGGRRRRAGASHARISVRRRHSPCRCRFAGARGDGRMRRVFGAPLGVLMVIVGLVLLIACTNLGSLLVARGVARQERSPMRLAIGASRARIVRQLITESLLLALAGGALGLVFAVWLSRALLQMVSAPSRRSAPPSLGLARGRHRCPGAALYRAGVTRGRCALRSGPGVAGRSQPSRIHSSRRSRHVVGHERRGACETRSSSRRLRSR